MAEIGYASLGIIPSFDGFARKLDSGTSRAMLTAGNTGGTVFGNAAGKTAGSRFGSVFKNAAKAGLVGIGALGVGAFALMKDSVSAASDLEESTNKVQQVFGKAADKVFEFSSTTADALGQTNQQARDAAATFGIFGKAAELSDKKNARFSKRMTTLASDLASFHNTSPEEAIEALGAALRGEAEPMRSYGVLLDDAALKAEALRLGLLKPVKDQAKIKAYQISVIEGQRDLNKAIKEHGEASFEAEKAEASLGTKRELLQKATEGTIPPLTQQQKVLAASSAIFKQTEVAQGDFARTSDGLANQQRRLSARFEDAKAKLGTGLLPIMTDAADLLLDKGIPAFEKFSGWFTKEGIPAIKEFTQDHLPEIKDGLHTLKDVAEDVAPILEGMFDGFNKLPDGLKKAIVMGAGAGFLGKKFGLLGGGGGGLTSSVASKVVPIRTFETNPAALGGGLGAGTGAAGGGAAAAGTRAAGLGRTFGRAFVGFLVADGIYEALVGDAYGLDPNTKEDPRDELSPIIKTGGGAFGAGLNQDPDALGGKTFKEGLRFFDDVVTATNRSNAAINTWGLRVGSTILGAQRKAGSFDDKLTLVGSRKIMPEVQIRGIERARDQVDGLSDALSNLTTQAAAGVDAAAGVVIGGVNRNRRRNLGGMP